MKKVLFFLACIVGLAACTDKKNHNSSTLKIEVYKSDVSLPFDAQHEQYKMAMSCDVVYFGGDDDLAQYLNKNVINLVFGDETSNSVAQAAEKCQQMLYDEYREGSDLYAMDGDEFLDYMLNYEYSFSGSVAYESARWLTYCSECYVYQGGAHGVNTRFYRTFNLRSASSITQDDILETDYEKWENVHNLMLQKIVEQDNDLALVEEIENKGYYPLEIYPNDNFYLTDSSIVFVFNPYDIGPYAMGDIEVELPFELLSAQGLLKESFLKSFKELD